MENALIYTLSLLDSLQTERGVALLPTCQTDHIPVEDFDDLAQASHEILVLAQKNNPDFWAVLPENFFEAFAKRNNAEFRSSLNPVNLREWYVFNLEHPMHQLAISHLTSDAHFSPSQMSALIHYIASLLYLSQLRDLGTIVYTKAEITPTDSRRMKNAASSYLARERLFLGLADENLRQIIEDAQNTYVTTSAETDALLRKIKDGYAKGVLASTPLPDWLENLNREIKKLQTSLLQAITKLTQQAQEMATTNLSSQTLDSDIEHALHAIRTLPLFRGLSEAALRNLLKGARLMEIDKNGSFMSQGDPTQRFFIMMEGWAKTTKTTAEGQEAIVQILGKRECVLDIGYANASIAALNGRAITKCKLLSLSLPILRDHASRNRELAQNLLNATTTRLQKLVSQFEQITLRTAHQRVGWFLVNLHLETGIEGAPLKLPFDKALIASYLNLKPETFSRVLKDFRGQGFIIEKDHVTLPSPQALCAYCDPEMALRCCRAEATNCAPIRAARRAEGRA